MALADGLESFAGELREAIDEAEQTLMENAMNVYYAAEELIKDPEHAHLIPYVEQMRAIYLRDFGTEIPPRKCRKTYPQMAQMDTDKARPPSAWSW